MKADNIVVANSKFGVGLQDSTGDGTSEAIFTANSTGTLAYHGLAVKVTESEVSLGGGSYDITVDLSAQSDIFPTAGSGGYGEIALGALQTPFQLTTPFDLTAVNLTFKNGSGSTILATNAIGSVANPDPWDGHFPQVNYFRGYSGTVGVDVQDINTQFIGTAIPTPLPKPFWSGLVCLLGLAGWGLFCNLRTTESARI